MNFDSSNPDGHELTVLIVGAGLASAVTLDKIMLSSKRVG